MKNSEARKRDEKEGAKPFDGWRAAETERDALRGQVRHIDDAVTELLTAISLEQPDFEWTAERTADAVDVLTKLVASPVAAEAAQPFALPDPYAIWSWCSANLPDDIAPPGMTQICDVLDAVAALLGVPSTSGRVEEARADA